MVKVSIVLVTTLVFGTLVSACTSAKQEPENTVAPTVTQSTPDSGQETESPAASAKTNAPPAPAQLSYSDLYKRRQELVDKGVRVRGRVLFVLTCPPPATGQAPPCIASAYLTDPATTDLLPGDVGSAVRLFRNGAGIGCAANTTANLVCADLRHGALYEVTGRLIKSFNSVVLDVTGSVPAE